MNREFLDAMFDYIDKKIEYKLASIEVDEEGYGGSCVIERNAMEKAKAKLISISEEV